MGKIRRPLLWVCLLLVTGMLLRRGIAGRDGMPDFDPCGLENGTAVTVTGKIYQKDQDTIRIKSVQVHSDGEFSFFPKYYFICEMKESVTQERVVQESETQEGVTLRLGNRVTLDGLYYDYARATNPGEFDADQYYASFNIGGQLRGCTVKKISDGYSPIAEGLYQLRTHWSRRLYEVFPGREASVMATMLLGEKEELDRDIKELYRRNGVIHILSISGLHISIIGMGIYRLLRKLGAPPWLSAILGSVVLLLYGCMIGFGVSACRAIGMYLMRMLAEIVGRTYDMATALGTVAAGMLLLHPGYLWNSGFWLSFGAVTGIVVLVPILPGPRAIKGGIAINIMTLPIQLWFYYEVPVYSILLNLLILPFVSVVVVCGMIVLLLPGSGVLGTIVVLILACYEKLCVLCDRLPFHTWMRGQPKICQVLVYYGLLFLFVCMRYRQVTGGSVKESQKSAAVRLASTKGLAGRLASAKGSAGRLAFTKGSAVRLASTKGSAVRLAFTKGSAGQLASAKGFVGQLAFTKGLAGKEAFTKGLAGFFGLPGKGVWILPALAFVLLAGKVPEGNRVTFLDVGQGDAIVIETASGEVYLADCGSSSRKQVGKYILLPYLQYRGIRRIEAVLVSHADFDHSGGVEELLQLSEKEGIEIGELILPSIGENQVKEEFASLLQTNRVREVPVPVAFVQAGDYWERGDVSFTCLHPQEGFTGESNAGSECFYVRFGEQGRQGTLLLTGDVEKEGEEQLAEELKQKGIEDVTVLKVAHHGSRFSTGESFLEQLDMRLAVISCGRNKIITPRLIQSKIREMARSP